MEDKIKTIEIDGVEFSFNANKAFEKDEHVYCRQCGEQIDSEPLACLGSKKIIFGRRCKCDRKEETKRKDEEMANHITPYISIMEEDLDRLVINKLRNVLSIDASGADCKDRIIDISKMNIEVVEKHRISLSLKISKLNSELKKLYEAYSLGNLEKEEYLEERILNRNKLNTYEKELSNLDLEILSIEAKTEEELELFDYLTSYKDIKLDEEIIPKYIDRIDVYDNETIKISLKGYLGRKEMKSNE